MSPVKPRSVKSASKSALSKSSEIPVRSPEVVRIRGRKIDSVDATNILRLLPKVDLHCHLDGSLRPATVLELARERGVRLPADNLKDLPRYVQVSPTCRSLKEFLDVFYVLYPLIRDAAAIERVAYELVEDCAADNIRHVEVRFAPALNASEKFTIEAVLTAAQKGLERGLKDFGVTSGLIVCLFRSHGPSENRKVFDAIKRLYRPEEGLTRPAVVGMDLAGDEARFPTMEYADYYQEAKKLGIRTTCHAGETVGTANLEAALSLDVMRIGHGINLMQDRKLLNEVVRRKIPVEIGITSNVVTRTVNDLQSHPARNFYTSGVPISLNTDDRGIIGIDLTHEYETALKLGFSAEELADIAVAAVEHSFLPEEHRSRLKRRFQAEVAKLSHD